MKRISLLFALSFTISAAYAQFSSAAYQFGEMLPQSSFMNPAFMPEYRVVIGLPGLSSAGIDGTTGFSFNDLFTYDNDDSLIIDRESIINGVNGRLDNSVSADVQIFLLGLKMNKGYLDVSVRARSENRISYPSEFLKWAVAGPADDLVSDIIDLNDIQAFSANYLEYSLGYARQVNDMVTIGIRAKMISGLAGGRGTQNGTLQINSDQVRLTLDGGEYYVSGASAELPSTPEEILNSGNTGFGIDIGTVVAVTDKMKVNASVVDLGRITWTKDIQAWEGNTVDYSFTGVDLVSLIFDDNPEDPNAEIDTLISRITPEEISLSEFTTSLNTKFTAGVTYDLGLIGQAGATLYSSYNQGKLDPVFGLSYRLKLKRWLGVVTGVSYRERSIDNIMAGLIVKSGPMQMHIMTDRVNTFLNPSNAHSVNFRFGINLTIGKPGITDEE